MSTRIVENLARRVVRKSLSTAMQVITVPLRAVARAGRPPDDPRWTAAMWLWQPGWGRGRHNRLYATPNPYGISQSAYEQSKYQWIMDKLDGHRFSRTLEVGCGEGDLSVRLATVSDELLGVDISADAIRRAGARFAANPHVEFDVMALPFEMPEGTFDLIVCSDVLYYWENGTLGTGLDRLLGALRPGGRLVALHYLGDFGQANDGNTVHDLLARKAVAPHRHVLAETDPTAAANNAGVRLDIVVSDGQ